MNKFEKPMVIIGSLLFPFYFIPWIIKYMLQNKLTGYILFSLFLAYLAYLTIPYDTWDITRHYEKFIYLSNINFFDVIQYGRIFDRMLFIYMWVISHLGLPKEFVPFSITFITYMIYFLTLKKIGTLKRFQKNFTFFMVISLFLILNEIRFFGVSSGLRNDLAFAIFIYALIDDILFSKKIKFYLLSILSISIHISVLPLFLLYLISKIITFKKIFKILMIISFLIMIFGLSEYLFFKIIEILKPFLQSHGLYFHAYMDPNGEWGSAFWQTRNFKTILFEKYIKPLPFYLIGIYLIIKSNILNKKVTTYLYVLFIFIALVSVSRTMFDRYNYFFTIFFIFIFLIQLNINCLAKYIKLFLISFIIALLLVDFGELVKERDVYIKSWLKTLYIPMPFNLLNHVEKKDYIHRESL